MNRYDVFRFNGNNLMNCLSIFDFLLWHNKRINFRKEQTRRNTNWFFTRNLSKNGPWKYEKPFCVWKPYMEDRNDCSFYVEFTQVISPTGLIKGRNRWKASAIGQSSVCCFPARKRQILHLLVDPTKIGTA